VTERTRPMNQEKNDQQVHFIEDLEIKIKTTLQTL